MSVSDERFEITDQGVLKLKDDQSLDYETETAVTLTITADDSKENGKTEQQITITVTNDESDDATTPNQLTATLQTNNIGGNDNVINIEEAKADTQTVEIKVENLQDGENPVFKIGETELSGSLKDGSTYTVAIPKANLDLETGENKSVTIIVTGDKGSTGADVSASYAVDVTAPTVVITSAEFNQTTMELVVAGTTEAGATVSLQIDGAPYQATAEADGKFTVNATGYNLEENARDVSITATATDTAGNTGNEATTTATIPAANDNPPTPTLSNDNVSIALVEDTGSNTTDNITKNGKLKVNGVDGQQWIYRVDKGAWQTGSGSEISQTALGEDGDKTVYVSLSQDGTSPIDNPKSCEFTLDTTTTEPQLSVSVNGNTLTGTISAEAGAEITSG